jgi:N-acetylglucosaminyl-diphospho-decaprenol L-rhamnosyltransferase
MPSMQLSIIIVNWNALDYLNECVASIFEHTSGITIELIIVDNASTKGDVRTLNEAFPGIRIILSKENLGFSRANNLGFRHSSGEYVLLLNPDTKLLNPAINLMLDRIESLPDAGIVGCRHVNPDLTVQTTSIQKFPTILNELLNIEYLRLRWPGCPLWDISPLFDGSVSPLRVDVIPGACMLLRREVYEQAGLLSEDYFMYAEDIDLNAKVARMGLKSYYIPDAVIIHYGGRSSDQHRQSQWATMMQYHAMAQYYAKHYGRFYAAMYRAAVGAAAVARLMILALAFPLRRNVRKTQSIAAAFQKWGAVLKWACGLAAPSGSVSGNR